MNEVSDTRQLEESLLARARQLADEERQLAEQARERLLTSARQRLEQRRQQVEAQAQQQAQRHFRQLVQRAELALAAQFEQLRWTLIESVYDDLRDELQELVDRADDYRDLLLPLLAEGCRAIDDTSLSAQLSNRDLERFHDDWPQLVTAAGCEKKVALSANGCDCSGGVLLHNDAADIRYDNTFEGRLARLHQALAQTIGEHLFAGIDSNRTNHNAG